MHTDKIKVNLINNQILIENLTNCCLNDCFIVVKNIFYCKLLDKVFNLNPYEKIFFDLENYAFNEEWKSEKIFVKIYANSQLIFQKNFQDKTKCFIIFSNEKFEGLIEQLIIGLKRYTNEEILHYTINYKSKLNFDYLNNIEYIVPGSTDDPQYMQFIKPLIFLDVIERGYKNAVFIDADVQVRSNIGDIFSYIKEIEEGPIFHKSRWDYTLLNGSAIPAELLRNYMGISNQKAPHGVTNFVVFSNKHYNLFKEWKEICFSKEINEIRKQEFLHDELILNCLMWKKNIKPKLFYFGLNVIDEKDVVFFYDYESKDLRHEIDLNSFNLGHFSQSVFPYDKSEVLGFHCVKNIEIAKKINDLIFKREILRYKSDMSTIQIYNNLKKQKITRQNIEPTFIIDYLNGACLRVSNSLYDNHLFSFINKTTGKTEYTGSIKNDHWAKVNKQYFIDWKVVVAYGDKIYAKDLNLENEKVHIKISSSSLGDNLAWIPYVEEFRKKHNCKMFCSTFFNYLFQNQYEHINFVPIGHFENEVKAVYDLGWFFNENKNEINLNKNVKDFRIDDLQKTASDILGLEFKEIKPKIQKKKIKNYFSKKYVCIATQSTSQCKYWNNLTGWQQVVDYLKSIGYEVVCVDRYSSFGIPSQMNFIPNGCINKTGDLPLEDRINDLMHCEFFIGLGSGLSWLAWACDKPVIMISGFSDPKSEFYTPYRVHNKNVCNSCWNDSNHKFDPSNWLWCPRNKNFECSREITFPMVKEKIDQCINDLKISS